MKCREGDDPFTKLGQDLFALHRFSEIIAPSHGGAGLALARGGIAD
jgi:hypothetical protein